MLRALLLLTVLVCVGASAPAQDPRMYSQISGTTTVLSGSSATLRPADYDAIYSCVTNSGTGRMILSEGGVVVGVLNADQVWSSYPKSGKLALTGSGTTTATVATYK